MSTGIRRPARAGTLCAALLLCVTGPLVAQQGDASPHGTLPKGMECTSCHTPDAWRPVRKVMAFRHDRDTGFALTGQHAALACASCHADLRFDSPAVVATDCGGCHVDPHQGQEVERCATCHTTRSFQNVDGEAIHQRTAFPLTGAHLQISCESCHVDDAGGAFTSVSTSCVSCHRGDYRNARAVDHMAAGYPETCTECHNSVAWVDTSPVDHALLSNGFALTGAHEALSCSSCHTDPGSQLRFPTPAGQDDCVACHQADYDHQHGGSGFPTTCTTCHTVNSWDGATVDHASLSGGFQLLGAHASQTCDACHAVPGYQLLFPAPAGQDDCVACHQSDYDRQHGGSGFPTTCSSCHTVNSWDGATVDHASLSGGFQLLGAHASQACTACHAVPGYQLLFPSPTGQDDCVACHQADYDRQHQGSGFPTTCTTCHTVNSWTDASFDHDAQYFPIYSGTHNGRWSDCSDCHETPSDFSGFTCLSCHAHDRTTTDQHHSDVRGYVYDSNECYSCHRNGRGG